MGHALRKRPCFQVYWLRLSLRSRATAQLNRLPTWENGQNQTLYEAGNWPGSVSEVDGHVPRTRL